MRAVLRAKAERGERLGTRAPYGYRKDENDSKKLVVDEEAAAVVRRIFAMCAAGTGPMRIAKELQKEQILCATVYVFRKYGTAHTGLNLDAPYRWSGDTIRTMLENEVYLGNTVNMRYSTKSYKDKRRIEHPTAEGYRIQRGSFYRQGQSVHGHHGADTGTATTVHPENRGA